MVHDICKYMYNIYIYIFCIYIKKNVEKNEDKNLTYDKRGDLNATVLNVQKMTKAADEEEV